MKATSQLYRINSRQGGRRDTTFVAGKFSDAGGNIAFSNLEAGSYLLDPILKEYPRYVLFNDQPLPPVKIAVLGSEAGIIGAAMLS